MQKNIKISTSKKLTGIQQSATLVDAQMEKYEQINAKTDRAEHTLTTSGFTQFAIASVVMFIAMGGAFINFKLIALPMSAPEPAPMAPPMPAPWAVLDMPEQPVVNGASARTTRPPIVLPRIPVSRGRGPLICSETAICRLPCVLSRGDGGM